MERGADARLFRTARTLRLRGRGRGNSFGENLEQDCRHPRDRARGNPGRHGFHGWLHTTVADPKLGMQDNQLVKEVLCALAATLIDQGLRAVDTIKSFLGDVFAHQIKARFDPNDWETMKRRPRESC